MKSLLDASWYDFKHEKSNSKLLSIQLNVCVHWSSFVIYSTQCMPPFRTAPKCTTPTGRNIRGDKPSLSKTWEALAGRIETTGRPFGDRSAGQILKPKKGDGDFHTVDRLTTGRFWLHTLLFKKKNIANRNVLDVVYWFTLYLDLLPVNLFFSELLKEYLCFNLIINYNLRLASLRPKR